MLSKLRRMLCRHQDTTYTPNGRTMRLTCMQCGWTSDGWTITENAPRASKWNTPNTRENSENAPIIGVSIVASKLQ